MAVQRAADSSARPAVLRLNGTFAKPVRKASFWAAWYAGLVPCKINAATSPLFMSATS